MPQTINQRIEVLEKQLADTQTILQELIDNIKQKYPKPLTISGQLETLASVQSPGLQSALGRSKGNFILWNSSEIDNPANIEPTDPETLDEVSSYNIHPHSRWSGGALIKGVLEIVEYVWGTIVNKHSPQFWQEQPQIATEVNSKGETVKKIGQLELIFNPDTLKWGTSAFEIDIKKCYFVERDDNGDIALDSKGQQKRSPLYNVDTTKSSIVWDENGNCFRLYSVYAPGS